MDKLEKKSCHLKLIAILLAYYLLPTDKSILLNTYSKGDYLEINVQPLTAIECANIERYIDNYINKKITFS